MVTKIPTHLFQLRVDHFLTRGLLGDFAGHIPLVSTNVWMRYGKDTGKTLYTQVRKGFRSG
jgi:hypothetical protein